MKRFLQLIATLNFVMVCAGATGAHAQASMDVIVVYGDRYSPQDVWHEPGQQPTYGNQAVWNVNNPADPAGRIVETSKRAKSSLKSMCGQKAQDGSSLDPYAATTSRDSIENRQVAVEYLFTLLFVGNASVRNRLNGTVVTVRFSDGGTERYVFQGTSTINAAPAPDNLGGPQYTPGNGVRTSCGGDA
jgi:hypothetical protein